MEHGAACSSESKAYENRLCLRSLYAESCISLRVYHRIFLSWLVEFAWLEVLYRFDVVESRIEISDYIVRFLRLQVFVEEQGIVGCADPRVAVGEVPERHHVDDILMFA